MKRKFDIGEKVYYSLKSYGLHTVLDYTVGEEGIEYLLNLDLSDYKFWTEERKILKLDGIGKTNHYIHTLMNGVRIANFSSNHEFRFDDGTILPGVTDELCNRLKLEKNEELYKSLPYYDHFINLVTVSFSKSDNVIDELAYWKRKFYDDEVDLVIVPLPVLRLFDENDDHLPFVGVNVMERTEPKVIYSNKFCV